MTAQRKNSLARKTLERKAVTRHGGKRDSSLKIAKDSFWGKPSLQRAGLKLKVRQAIKEHEQLCKNSGADACLVAYKGQLVSERYWNRHSGVSQIYAMSSTKSVVSIVLGIMVDRKLLRLNTRVAQFIPQWRRGKASKVTIRHLLTHTSGLMQRTASRGPNKSIGYVENKTDFVIRLKPTRPPGHVFSYSNEGAQLLGLIMQERLRRMHTSLPEYAQQFLFKPLGISPHTLFRSDSIGSPITYADLQITPRDMLKIGLMMQKRGTWNGKRIVSSHWVSQSTSTQYRIEGASSLYPGCQCGYLWWTFDNLKGFAALGRFDTDLFVFPGAELIVFRSQFNGAEYSYQQKALPLFDIILRNSSEETQAH